MTTPASLNAPVPRESLAKIRLLILDVDGVLTDGAITLDADGREIKSFSVRDGLGLKVWHKLGLHSAIISGRNSPIVAKRAETLGIGMVFQGSHDKLPALAEAMKRTGATRDEVAYVGDDWPDAPIFAAVGLPIAVADAEPSVKSLARLVTHRPGGRGAVREVIELLLKSRGMSDHDLIDVAVQA
ncbi:MAG: HAD hydrolase family protein [Planctomycetota bacterium]|nr:HAD hydrolase family protein [Planctomycetota bacterium]